MKKYPIAVVGATGLVGSTLMSLLAERNFPISELHLLASDKSAGEVIHFSGQDHKIIDLAHFDFSKSKIAFFCVGKELSEIYAPLAAAAGNVVIDKSYQFRNHADIPLIVPEVNISTLPNYRNKNIIACPNCNTIPVAVALKPIYDSVGINRINISTYQSVSGTGKNAIQELTEQTKQLLNNQPIQPKVYSQQIAFNVLPHIDDFQDNGYTREEMKIVWEMRKIFNDDALAINPTAVRVPVYCGHAAAIHLETKKKISAAEAEKLFSQAVGIKLMTGEYPYPTPVKDAAGRDPVYVGRIREDISHSHGLNLWVVADNLRKGAALNSIQIAETLIERYLS